jgi:hypothetical protein
MVNVDSVLNNFSTLLVSGLLTSASFQNSLKQLSTKNLKLSGRRGVNSIAPKSSRSSSDFIDTVNVARSQLETASLISNVTDEFHPPQTQPRCPLLIKIATTLQAELFRSPDDAEDTGALDKGVAAVTDLEFATTACAFFLECVEEGRQLVPQMRATHHKVWHGHLTIYLDALKVVRMEPIFPKLQKESERLV